MHDGTDLHGAASDLPSPSDLEGLTALAVHMNSSKAWREVSFLQDPSVCIKPKLAHAGQASCSLWSLERSRAKLKIYSNSSENQ